jgi:hypothetical protein
MRPSYRPAIPPKPQSYRTQVLDHLGLVAGMFEELGITEVIDKATGQNPEMRLVTVGHAVKAMVLNGLGFVNQQLYLVPHFFQNKPLARLIAPGIQASQLNDDTLGRALDTLYAYGVTELYSLIVATAGRGRDTGYPAPPAQIPACGTTAPGSCLGSDVQAPEGACRTRQSACDRRPRRCVRLLVYSATFPLASSLPSTFSAGPMG